MIILIVLFIWWTSPQPVAPETQRITVTGGVLQSTTISDDGLSGVIEIVAPRECAAIEWSIRTRGGSTFRSIRAWRDGCDKFYLPVLRL